jgi:hypothetical protein
LFIYLIIFTYYSLFIVYDVGLVRKWGMMTCHMNLAVCWIVVTSSLLLLLNSSCGNASLVLRKLKLRSVLFTVIICLWLGDIAMVGVGV